MARAGALPETEALILGRLMRLCLPGLNDAQYARSDAEIAAHLAAKAGGPATVDRVGFEDIRRW